MTNYEIWQAVLAEFELKLSKANFTTWFKSTGIAKFSSGEVAVCVPNAFTKSWLEKKYHSDIVKTLEHVTGKPVKKIEYHVENIKHIAEMECALSEMPAISSAKTPIYSEKKQTLATRFGLNPKYTFSTFIVGKGNELSHAASQAVASRPGDAYNPLFIYGGVGLGKTHLLQAIAQKMLENNPNTKIMYVNSEKFTNDFISSVKEGRAKEFKSFYRSLNALLIDDIQFFAGKDRSQEEFFHTFNAILEGQQQIVLTSDRYPKEIEGVEERLKSRFGWGLTVVVEPPELETRVAILVSKAEQSNIELPYEVAFFIAKRIRSNVRELEGALRRVIA